MTTDFFDIHYEDHTILIVDDNPTNISVIAEHLRKMGFRLRVAQSGERALKVMEDPENLPDLILLDVMMPEIDGFEVCRRLKANKVTENVPIIFMTALTETADKVRGFDVGGEDYITKPFQAEEVLARVKAHLRIHKFRQMQERLLLLEKERSAALSELNNHKDKLFSILSHDLRAPFNGLLGYAQLLMELAEEPTTDRQEIEEMAECVFSSGKAAYELLENLLTWSRMQRDHVVFEPCKLMLYEIVQNCVHVLHETAVSKNITLHNEVDESVYVHADRNMLEIVIRNLTSNAIKFSLPDSEVTICASPNEDDESLLSIAVVDHGIGIAPEDIEKLFRMDAHHSTPGTKEEAGTGLGLLLCQEMVEKSGGNIWVESQLGQGTTFTFTVPLAVQEALLVG